jgi:hypothetical protein
MYSKIGLTFNSLDSILSVEVCSSIPSMEMYCLLDNPPHIRPNGRCMWDEPLEMMELSGDSLHGCALNSSLSTLAKISDAPKVWN